MNPPSAASRGDGAVGAKVEALLSNLSPALTETKLPDRIQLGEDPTPQPLADEDICRSEDEPVKNTIARTRWSDYTTTDEMVLKSFVCLLCPRREETWQRVAQKFAIWAGRNRRPLRNSVKLNRKYREMVASQRRSEGYIRKRWLRPKGGWVEDETKT